MAMHMATDPVKQPYKDTPVSVDDDTAASRHRLQALDREQGLVDPDLDGLTLYEKKAVLVNRELDRQGMGRYQWNVFILCGLGYFLDLLWAQAFGLVMPILQLEFGFDDAASGNIFTCFSAGLTAGAAFWGIIVDIIGRYWAFNFTVLFTSVFGLALGAPDTYTAVLILTAFVGIGIGGNIPIDTTITLECLPQDRRWLLPTLSIFQPLGVVICSAIVYGFIPNYSCADADTCVGVAPGAPCCRKADNWGWRYVMFTLGAISLLIFIVRFVVFRFQESPKFLLYRGQDEKAVEVLQFIAKYNKKDCQITLETFSALEGDTSSSSTGGSNKPALGSGLQQQDLALKEKLYLELYRFKVLFSTFTMARFTILVWITYMFDYWGFTIAGSFLPRILYEKGNDLGWTRNETYRNYIFIYIFGIPGVLLGTTIYKWRWISLLLSSAMFGAMLFTFTAVNSQASYIGINGLVYFFQSMFNAILSVYPLPVSSFEANHVLDTDGRPKDFPHPFVVLHVVLPASGDASCLFSRLSLRAMCLHEARMEYCIWLEEECSLLHCVSR
jgi:MFS family permease